MTTKMRARCAAGERPRTAYRDTESEIPRNFLNPNDQATVANVFPSYSRVRSALYRQRNKKVLPVPNEEDLPLEYRLTLAGRERLAAHDDANLGPEDHFLLYQGERGLIFMSKSCREILLQSEFWVCDGTFTYVPNQFAQLYTIHGFFRGEGLPLAHALLKDKSQATYEHLFSTLRGVLVNNMGAVGNLHTVLLDFELAAHRAVATTFGPTVSTRGCTFHLGKALWRKAMELGLKGAYEEELTGVKQWMSMLRGLALLPPHLVDGAWNELLCHPPQIQDAMLGHKLQAFVQYFQNTWMNGSLRPLWNHHDNVWLQWEEMLGKPGPRTTNHTEGWHSDLHNDFGQLHPTLPTFLHWLQGFNNSMNIRITQLTFPKCPASSTPSRSPLCGSRSANCADRLVGDAVFDGRLPVG